MNARTLLIIASLAVPTSAAAQGFAGLGEQTDEGFALPTPAYDITFPQDHGAHPEYRIEWWYLTANLEGPDGTPYGIQWTLFRNALEPRSDDTWSSPQIWMGHAGLTTEDAHYVGERFARDGIGQAGVTAQPFNAWIDSWSMTSTATAGDAYSELEVRAQGEGFSYDLSLSAEGPLVFQGRDGFSVKSESGTASYYYSQPFYRITGTLQIGEETIPVTGQGWLDREWSSQPLEADQTGWDWFSLHLDSGEKVMMFQLRSTQGRDYSTGTWVFPDGRSEELPVNSVQLDPLEQTEVAGRSVPTSWRVQIPSRGLDIETTAINPSTWMDTVFPYWEGPIRFAGSHGGRGYLEMTGYE